MAKKTEKKTEELEVQTVENKETTKPVVEETTTTPTVEKVLQELEEKIEQEQPKETKIPEVVLDKEIQEIADEFKDTSKRLDTLVKENPNNITEVLEKELDTVDKAVKQVEKALKEAEAQIPKEAKSYLSRIKDLGSWWNGSNSGL
jgi:ABC-type transporter Mla subunit MlaD